MKSWASKKIDKLDQIEPIKTSGIFKQSYDFTMSFWKRQDFPQNNKQVCYVDDIILIKSDKHALQLSYVPC